MPILLLVLLYYRVKLMAWLFGFGGQSKAQKLERELQWTKNSFAQASKEATLLRQTNGRMSAEIRELDRTKEMLGSVAQKRLDSIADLERQLEEVQAALKTCRLECEATDVLLMADRDKLREVQSELDDSISENKKLSQSIESLSAEKQALQDKLTGFIGGEPKKTKASRTKKKS